MCSRTSDLAGTRRERVDLGAQRPQPARAAPRPRVVGAEHRAVDRRTSRRPRRKSGSSGIGGSRSARNEVVTSSGAPGAQAAHSRSTGSIAVEVPDHHPGVRRPDVVHAELQRGDHAEAAAAAAHGPEELRVRGGVGADERAVADHDLDGGEAVGGQAELAGVPADAAAERVAGDADVGGASRAARPGRGRRPRRRPAPRRRRPRPGRCRGPGRRSRCSSRRCGRRRRRRGPGRRAGRRCGRCSAGRPAGRCSAAARTTAETSAAVRGTATAAGRWSTATFHGRRGGVVAGVPGQVDAAADQAAQGGGGPVGGRSVRRTSVRSMVMVRTPCRFGGIRAVHGRLVRGALGSRLGTSDLGRRRGRAAPPSLCCARGGGGPRPGRGRRWTGARSTSARPSSARWSPRSPSPAAGRSRSTRSSTCSGATPPPPGVTATLQAYVAAAAPGAGARPAAAGAGHGAGHRRPRLRAAGARRRPRRRASSSRP